VVSSSGMFKCTCSVCVLQRGPRITLKSSSAAPAYLAYKGSMPDILKPSEEPLKVYPYEQLKLTNPQLPADVDRNSLEVGDGSLCYYSMNLFDC
jgi:hypothetical protein